jgi:hypothetical protein
LVIIAAVDEIQEMHAPSNFNRISYLSALNGVRAIAVLLVIWSHFPYVTGPCVSQSIWTAGQALRTGYVGVDLFFVLSGFLITTIPLNERDIPARSGGGGYGLKFSPFGDDLDPIVAGLTERVLTTDRDHRDDASFSARPRAA